MKGVWFTELNIDPNDFKWEEDNPDYYCNVCNKQFYGGYRKNSLQHHLDGKAHREAKNLMPKEKEEEEEEDPLRTILETRIKQAAKKRILSDEYMDDFMKSPLGQELVKERMLKKLKEKGY